MTPAGDSYVRKWREGVPRARGLEEKARSAARHLALSVLGLLSAPPQGPFLRGLYCHYVFDDQRDRFAAIIRALMRRGRFVDTASCIAMLAGKQPIDGPCFHLSFDDGFKNIVENAAPILSDLGVPALLFVPTGIIGAGWEKTRHYCIETTRYPAVMEMASWNDLRKLPSYGVEVVSHTRSHARLSSLSSTSRLKEEIALSKLDIEDRLGLECRYLSWPYGRREDVSTAALDEVRRAGYRACFGAFRGTIRAESTDVFRIPRGQFEVQWPLRHIAYFAGGHFES